MIGLLKSLLGATTGERPARKAAPRVTPRPVSKVRDFRAISLRPGLVCCTATKDNGSKRHLWREAPSLPLPSCTMRSACCCRFLKHPDRRDGERRLLGGHTTKQWFVDSERRSRQSRRAA